MLLVFEMGEVLIFSFQLSTKQNHLASVCFLAVNAGVMNPQSNGSRAVKNTLG